MALEQPIPTGTVTDEEIAQQDDAQQDDAQPVIDYKQNPRYRAMQEVVERAKADRAAEEKEPQPTVTDDEGNVVQQGGDSAQSREASPAEDAQQSGGEGEVRGDPGAAPAGVGEAPAAGAGAADAAQVAAPGSVQPVRDGEPAGTGIDPNAEYTMMVDGRPVKFKGSQVIDAGRRTLQKESAADHRLQVASQLLEEAKRTAGFQQQPGQPHQPNSGQPALPPGAQGGLAVTAEDLAAAEGVQFGTKEQAAQVIASIRDEANRAAQAAAQQQANIPAVIDARMQFQKAVEKAQADYGDLLADPILARFFQTEENRLREAGDKRHWGEVYAEIGEGMRRAFNRPKPAAAGVPTVVQKNGNGTQSQDRTMAQRQDAKRAAPAAPKLASARLDSGGEQKPKSREDIIEAMRLSRGQGRLNK